MALALRRKRGDKIQIGDNIIITLGETRGSWTTVLVEAPKNIPVARIEGNTDGNGSSPSKRAGRRQMGKVLHRLPAEKGRNGATARTETGTSGGGGAPAADAAQRGSRGAVVDRESD